MKRPIVTTAVIFAIITLVFLKINHKLSLLYALFSLFLLLICIFYKAFRQFIIVLICVFILCINFYSVYNNGVTKYQDTTNIRANIEGIVTECSFNSEDVVMYQVNITKSTYPKIEGRKALLYGYNLSSNVGATLNAEVVISFIEDGFDWYSEDVYFKGYIDKVHNIISKTTYKNFIYKLRLSIRNILFENLPYDIATTINGITLGERIYEEDEFYAAVKNCGVSHIMVVSGLHLAVVCGSLYKLLKAFKSPPFINAIITLAVTFAFMALCGFTPSVLRAGTMYIIMLVGLLIHRDPDALNSLSVAFVIMVIINPFLMCNVGFLLSVTSTAGIIILNPLILKLIRHDKWKIKPLKAITEIATVTISAQLATLPICLYYFGWVSRYAVLVNILISYAVTIALISAFLGIIMSVTPLRSLSKILFIFCSFVTAYFNKIILFFGNL